MTGQTPKIEPWMLEATDFYLGHENVAPRIARAYEPEAKRVQGLVDALTEIATGEYIEECEFCADNGCGGCVECIAKEALDEYRKGNTDG